MRPADSEFEPTSGQRDPLPASIIGAAIEVHRALGPGLLESAYEECLCHEFNLRELFYERQVPVPIVYRGVELETRYRLDMLVAKSVIVEVKAIAAISDVERAQLLTYMRLTGMRVGLVLNFNVAVLKNGILRLVL